MDRLKLLWPRWRSERHCKMTRSSIGFIPVQQKSLQVNLQTFLQQFRTLQGIRHGRKPPAGDSPTRYQNKDNLQAKRSKTAPLLISFSPSADSIDQCGHIITSPNIFLLSIAFFTSNGTAAAIKGSEYLCFLQGLFRIKRNVMTVLPS